MNYLSVTNQKIDIVWEKRQCSKDFCTMTGSIEEKIKIILKKMPKSVVAKQASKAQIIMWTWKNNSGPVCCISLSTEIVSFLLHKAYIKGDEWSLYVCLSSCLLWPGSHDDGNRWSSLCFKQESQVSFIISNFIHGQSRRKLYCTYLRCVYSESRTRDQVVFILMPFRYAKITKI